MRRLLSVLKLLLSRVTARPSLTWVCAMRKAEECTRTKKRWAPWMSMCFVIIWLFSSYHYLYYYCKGSASLLASSSWGPQAGAVPPCKAASVQQGATECGRAEHSHRFPGTGSRSRTHWGIDDDEPWPPLLTGIITMLQNSLHFMPPFFISEVVMSDLQPWWLCINFFVLRFFQLEKNWSHYFN